MPKFRVLLCAAALISGTASAASAQQSIPAGPFQTVHMMIVAPGQEAALVAAVRDINRVFQAEGCSACAYHLAKLAGGQSIKYNYIMTGDWPGRDGYMKIHTSADYIKSGQKNPVLGVLSQTELYGEYVAVK